MAKTQLPDLIISEIRMENGGEYDLLTSLLRSQSLNLPRPQKIAQVLVQRNYRSSRLHELGGVFIKVGCYFEQPFLEFRVLCAIEDGI